MHIFFTDSIMQPWHLKTVHRNTRQSLPNPRALHVHSGINMVASLMIVQCIHRDVEAEVVARIIMVAVSAEVVVASTTIGMHRSTATCPHFYECKMCLCLNLRVWKLLSVIVSIKISCGAFLI